MGSRPLGGCFRGCCGGIKYKKGPRHNRNPLYLLARLERFELPTYGFVDHSDLADYHPPRITTLKIPVFTFQDSPTALNKLIVPAVFTTGTLQLHDSLPRLSIYPFSYNKNKRHNRHGVIIHRNNS